MWKSGEPTTKAQYLITVPIFEAVRVSVFELAVTTIQIRPGHQLRQGEVSYFRRGGLILDVSMYAPFALVPTEDYGQT